MIPTTRLLPAGGSPGCGPTDHPERHSQLVDRADGDDRDQYGEPASQNRLAILVAVVAVGAECTAGRAGCGASCGVIGLGPRPGNPPAGKYGSSI